MTRFYSRTSALPLALAVMLSTAGGSALFLSKANAAEAQPTTSVRCYIGAKHDSDTGWTCVPDPRSTAKP